MTEDRSYNGYDSDVARELCGLEMGGVALVR